MIIREGNIWQTKCDWLCIPTNNRVYRCRDTGRYKAVMGAGLAKQARDRVEGIEELLAVHLQTADGNVPGVIGFWEGKIIWSFPTKYHWRNPADLELVEQSAAILNHYWQTAQRCKDTVVALPEVGCGEGGLEWSEVEPRLKKHLQSFNFVVCKYKKNDWGRVA